MVAGQDGGRQVTEDESSSQCR